MRTRFKKPSAAPAVLALTALFWAYPDKAHAMHIAEGILPWPWAAAGFLLSAPIVYLGLREIKANSLTKPHYKPLTALVGAAVFIISCMPIPVPFTGTCSHPCGTGLAAILIGPAATVVVASVALTFQALFLAHGGLTTLGADLLAMGIAGAYCGYGAFILARRLGLPLPVAAFLAGMVSDWATYAVTAAVLAGALHGEGSITGMFWAIVLSFVPTQLPLGILEGIISAGALRFIYARRPALVAVGQ